MVLLQREVDASSSPALISSSFFYAGPVLGNGNSSLLGYDVLKDI